MKFFTKKERLRRRISRLGWKINDAKDDLATWHFESNRGNRGAQSVILHALIESEYKAKQEKIQKKIRDLEDLVNRYEQS
jgi:hypothetical protein